MGNVILDDHIDGHDTTVVMYLYCDKCGSFSIAKRLDSITASRILTIVSISFLYWISRKSLMGAVQCFLILVLLYGMTGAFGDLSAKNHGHEHTVQEFEDFRKALEDMPNPFIQ